MKTPLSLSSALEALEPRLAPAGLIAVSVNSAGTLVLGTVAGQDGDESVTIDRLANGSYQLTPDANVTLRIGGVDYTTAQTLFGVTGGLLANLGAGNDILTLNDCYFTKAVTVNLGVGDDVFTMANSTVGGALLFTGGDGFDTVGFNGNCAVGGAATLRMGAGNDLVYNSATRLGFGAGLLLDGGTGHDEFVLGGSSGGQVRIIGNLNCIAGTGEDTLSIGTTSSIFSATGSVMMSDAGGNDVMTIAGTRFSAGALVLQLGSGDNSLTTTVTDLFLVRNLQWQSTSGADNVFIGGGNLRVGTNVVIALGTGNDTALVNSSSSIYVGGLVTMTAAATVGVNRSLVLESSDVMVTGKVTLTGGAGDGFMRVAGSGSNYLGGGVALSCGLGQTNLRVSSNGSLICNGALSLTHGGGSGSLEVFDFGAGDSLINGAVTMKGGSFLSLNLAGVVTGAVNLATSPAAVNPPIIFAESSGADGTHFAGSVRASVPTLAGQVGTIRFAGAIFEGAATFLGGAGTDTLRLNNIDAEKALTASLGAGDDRFEFEQTDIAGPSLYHGAVLLQGGAGADVFLIGGDTAARAIDFRKAVTADGGTGSDTLTVGTQVTFAPGFPLVQKNIP